MRPARTQNVEHRSAVARRDRHDGVAHPRDREIGDEVAKRVADREDGQADDGVGEAKDMADGLCARSAFLIERIRRQRT